MLYMARRVSPQLLLRLSYPLFQTARVLAAYGAALLFLFLVLYFIQRRGIARAVAGAVHERQEQARQERRGRREKRVRRQDRHADVLKQARQPDAGTAGAKAAAMKAAAMKSMAASRIQAGTHDGPDRSRSSAGHRTPSRLAAAADHAFWTWLVPAAGVLAGILAMLAVLLAACSLL